MKKILLIINLLGLFSTAYGASSMGLGGVESSSPLPGADQKAAANGEQSAKYNPQALREVKKFIDRRVDELDHTPSKKEKEGLAVLVRKNLAGMHVTDEKIIQDALAYLDRAKPLSERLAAIRGVGPVGKAIGEGLIGAVAAKKVTEEEVVEVAPQKPESLMPWLMSLFGWQKRNDYGYHYVNNLNIALSGDGKVLVHYYPTQVAGAPVTHIVILNFDETTRTWQRVTELNGDPNVDAVSLKTDQAGSIIVTGNYQADHTRVYRRQPNGTYAQEGGVLQGGSFISLDAAGGRLVTSDFNSTVRTYHYAQGAWHQENNLFQSSSPLLMLSGNGLFLLNGHGDYYYHYADAWEQRYKFNYPYSMDFQGSIIISSPDFIDRELNKKLSDGTWEKYTLDSSLTSQSMISADGQVIGMVQNYSQLELFEWDGDAAHLLTILKARSAIYRYKLSFDNRRLVLSRNRASDERNYGDSVIETYDARLTLEQQKAIVRNAALINVLYDLYKLREARQPGESIVLTLAQEDLLQALPENLRKVLYATNKLLPASAGAEYARKLILERAKERKIKKEREGKRSDTKKKSAAQFAPGDIKRKVQAQPKKTIYPLPPIPQQTKAEQLRKQKEKATQAKKRKDKQAKERKLRTEQEKAYQARKKKEQEERKKGLELKRRQEFKRKEEAKKKKELEERKKAAATKRAEQALKKKRMEQARLQKMRQDRIKRQQLKKKRQEAIKKRKQLIQKKVQKARLQRAYIDDEQMTLKRWGYRPRAEL